MVWGFIVLEDAVQDQVAPRFWITAGHGNGSGSEGQQSKTASIRIQEAKGRTVKHLLGKQAPDDLRTFF